ncbi:MULTISPECIES: hypothetical protein [Ralstonia]|uniref:Uncharacterized protein n=1 Tax=Ralstonia thomasii TaxID=3058596 RepID=A0AAD2F6D4_9RALS|nr:MULTISPECIES: hypothetical protein [Ralstonia]CAJ0807600.1 hypothetical protein R77560_04598 [Ralstonia sp. LMG 18095]
MNKNLKIALVLIVLFGSAAARAGVSDVLADIGRAGRSVLGNDGGPTSVLAPGIRLNVGDRIVRVYGYDKCPRDWMDRATGKPAEEGCVVLDKTVVSVMFEDTTKEQWTVKKDGDRTYLIRPNGVPVSQAQ